MIKVETLGMLDIAKVNPVLKSNVAVENYSFLTSDGDLYLISNTLTGDDSYREDVSIPAGEYLNGFMVKAWEGQKLVVDDKHIAYGDSETYASLVVGTTLLTVNEAGKLAIASSAPSTGVYFKVTDKCTLTGKAIKAKVMVA
jgi:hypothetical protein